MTSRNRRLKFISFQSFPLISLYFCQSFLTFTDPILALEHFSINKNKYVLIISDLQVL